MGITPEQFLDDLRRVYHEQGKIGVEIYRWHGKYSDSSIMVKFGSWNRALLLAGLPTNYQTSKTKELLGEDKVSRKRKTYPCWECKEPFKGLGRRNGEWWCKTCRASIQRLADSMGYGE